ncbi:MAG: ankyrin repeat domain-containing protein, partial [Sedimenticola sp.]|nr:ankyrin repeat domain-containing protein [Sedimenticola sp.]
LQAKDGTTALYMASQNGHATVVQTLLDKGAKIDLQAKNGITALIVASYMGHQRIVKALLAEGANTRLRKNGGGTALKYAKKEKIKEMLRAAGATE